MPVRPWPGISGVDADQFVTMMNERARTFGIDEYPFHQRLAVSTRPVTIPRRRIWPSSRNRPSTLPAISMMVRTVVRDISTVDGARHVFLHSTNELLVDPDVNGVKTGYTSKAGRCLIASMFKDGHRLVVGGTECHGSLGTGHAGSFDTDRWHCETPRRLGVNSGRRRGGRRHGDFSGRAHTLGPIGRQCEIPRWPRSQFALHCIGMSQVVVRSRLMSVTSELRQPRARSRLGRAHSVGT